MTALTLPRPTTNRHLRMLKLALRPIEYFEDYHRQFGDCFAVGSEAVPFVYISDPKAIQSIFSGDRVALSSAVGGSFLETLLGSNSILLLQGQAHQRQRKLLMPPFHGERLRAYGDLIIALAQSVCDRLSVEQTIAVRDTMQEITLKVILQAVFGLYSGDRYEEIRQLLIQLLGSSGSPLTALMIFFPFLQKNLGKWSPWGRFVYLKQQVDRLLLAEIKERRDSGDLSGKDILSLLMAAQDEAGNPMTDGELRDELMTLLVAGHETTASALSWALYCLHSQPATEEKLRSELASLGDHPTPDAIAALPYLSAVCQETLRRYPIAAAAFPRITNAPLELMGYEIPAGAILSPCIYLVHQREDIYPNAHQFKPERFLERQFSSFEYLPFGGGDRRCIGVGLAMLEMKLVLAMLLSNHHFQLTSRETLKPVRRGLTLAPPESLRLRVTK